MSGSPGAHPHGTAGIPRLIKRNTAFFALAQALQGSGISMMVALGALMVLHLTQSPLLTGLGVSALQISRMLVSYPLGKLADSYGRRPAMLVGLSFGLVGAPILALSIFWESMAVFLVGALVFGMGVGAAQQLRVAVADMYPARRRGEAIGYLLTGGLIGTLFAPAIVSGGERLAVEVGINALAMPWLLMPLLLVPSMLIIVAVRPDPKRIAAEFGRYWPGESAQPRGAGGARMSYLDFLRSRPRLTAAVCFAPAQGVMVMLMASTPVVLNHHGHTLTAVSVAVTLHVIGMYAFSLPLGKLADLFGRTKLLGAGLAVEAVGALMVPSAELYWTITLGIFLVGVGWSAVFVATTALIADTSRVEERGRAVGVNDSLAAGFSIAMPMVGGLIAATLGLMPVGVFGALLVLLPLPMLARLRELAPGRFADEARQKAA